MSTPFVDFAAASSLSEVVCGHCPRALWRRLRTWFFLAFAGCCFAHHAACGASVGVVEQVHAYYDDGHGERGFTETVYSFYKADGSFDSSSEGQFQCDYTEAADVQAFVDWAKEKIVVNNYLHSYSQLVTEVGKAGFRINGAGYKTPDGYDFRGVTYYEIVPKNTPEPPKLTIKFLAHPASYTRLDVSDAALITLKLTSTANPASAEYRFSNADDANSAYPQEWQPLTQRTANDWELQLPILPPGVTKIEARARSADGTYSPIATTSVTYTVPPLVRGPAAKSVLKPVFDGSRNPAPALTAAALTGSTTFAITSGRLLGGEYAIDSREPGRALWAAQTLRPEGPPAFVTASGLAFWRASGGLSTSFLKALGSGVPVDAGEVYMTELLLDEPDVQQSGSFLLSYKFSLMVRGSTAAGVTLGTVPLTLLVKYGAVRNGQHYLPYNDSIYVDAASPRTLPEPANVVGAWIIRNDTQHELAPHWTVPGGNGMAQDRLRAAFSGLDHFTDGSAAKASAYAVKPIGSANVAGLLWSGLRETYYLAGDDGSSRWSSARPVDAASIMKATGAFSFSIWGVVDKSDPQSLAAVIASTPGTKPPAGADVTPPTLTLAAPKKGLRAAPGGSTPLQGTAKDNTGVTKVEWRWDSEAAWHEVPVTAAAKVDFNTIITTPAAGLRTLQARAYDAAGNRSATVAAAVTIAEADVTVTLALEGQGKVTGLKAGANVVPGALLRTVSASAATGWSFSHWSVGGVKTSEQTTWTFAPGASTAQISAVFVHENFAVLAGTYRAQWRMNDLGTIEGVQRGDATVTVDLTITAAGTCTGVYKVDGATVRFVRTFTQNRKLGLTVNLGAVPGNLVIAFPATAELAAGTDAGLQGWVEYWDAYFPSPWPATFELMRSEAGRHADYHELSGIFQERLMPVPSYQNEFAGVAPGWLRLVISSSGGMTASGKLPNCDAIAVSGTLWRAGVGDGSHVYVPLLQTLPSGRGMFDVVLILRAEIAGTDPLAMGMARWWHRDTFPAGGLSHASITLAAALAHHHPPGKSEPVVGGNHNDLTIPDYAIDINGENGSKFPFTLSGTSTVVFDGHPKGISLVLRGSDGTFTGTFVEPRTGISRSFSGFFNRSADGSAWGMGLFLHPTLGPQEVSVGSATY